MCISIWVHADPLHRKYMNWFPMISSYHFLLAEGGWQPWWRRCRGEEAFSLFHFFHCGKALQVFAGEGNRTVSTRAPGRCNEEVSKERQRHGHQAAGTAIRSVRHSLAISHLDIVGVKHQILCSAECACKACAQTYRQEAMKLWMESKVRQLCPQQLWPVRPRDLVVQVVWIGLSGPSSKIFQKGSARSANLIE